jgi:putative ABC transport system ATP-binding protein
MYWTSPKGQRPDSFLELAEGAGPRDDKPSLQARNLERVFGTGETATHALNDVSLDLYPGRITLLEGPSGSGKSTLLAVLSGLLRPDQGKVLALGQDLWRMSERQREHFRLRHCGFVFQGYNLFPALTARQQLELVLRWGEGATRREARRRTEEMLAVLGLANRAHLRPIQLSGGEKQRVAIGRALIKKELAFCFADEPTSALDWKHGEQVVDLLRAAAHERQTTILVVSHDPRIEEHVDQILHIADGCLTDAAPASEPALRSIP